MAEIKSLLIPAIISLFVFHPISCHFFSVRYFRQLVPLERIESAAIGKADAVSVIACNLECINKRTCISTLFTIHNNKCVLLDSFFREVEEFGETSNYDESAKMVESKLSDSSLLTNYQKREEKGTTATFIGFNCLEIKKHNGSNISGFYNIWSNRYKKATIKVFCDMVTDGGGWTQVLHVKSNTNNTRKFLKQPFLKWKNLTGFDASGNYMILPTALRNSSILSSDPQFRFKCKLARKNNTLHLMTARNSRGRAVVRWLTANSKARPDACKSYTRLPDDSSYLSRHCSAWSGRTGKWGIAGTSENSRFTDHLAYIYGTAHWNIFNNRNKPYRFECESQLQSRVIGKGDVWKIFVR